jgi:hypothetical protein
MLGRICERQRREHVARDARAGGRAVNGSAVLIGGPA